MIDWDGAVLAPVFAQFAEPVTYQPVAGSPLVLHGVFDDAYQRQVVLEDSSVAWTSESPTLGIRLAEWPTLPQQGETVTIQRTGVCYVITDARPDGHGAARLMLGESA